MSREQAVHLARVLLAAAQEWNEIDITAWRAYKRHSDGTYNVTVIIAARVEEGEAWNVRQKEKEWDE